MNQLEFARSSVWPREFTLVSGKHVLLQEPPPGVLWQVGLPPLDLVPNSNPFPEYGQKPTAWPDSKWEAYLAEKKARYLRSHAKWRKAAEKLACLLIFAELQPPKKGSRRKTQYVAVSYSVNPLDWQEDARLLNDTDLSGMVALVRPSFIGWEEFLSGKDWDYAATTAKYFGGFPSFLILGDPLHSALNIGIAQRAIRAENERAERAKRKGGK